MLLLTLIGCLSTLYCSSVSYPTLIPLYQTLPALPVQGFVLSVDLQGDTRDCPCLQGVCSLVGDIVKQIARTSALQAVCHASYPQTVLGFPRATTTAMFFSYCNVLIFLYVSNSPSLAFLILWASLHLCREGTLKEYLSPSYIFASVSNLLIHSFNMNQIPTLHHPLDFTLGQWTKQAKMLSPMELNHPPDTYFYLSDIPFLLLKMSSHDDFHLPESGRF